MTEASLQTANQAVGVPGLGKGVPAAREDKAPALSGELGAVVEAASTASLRKTPRGQRARWDGPDASVPRSGVADLSGQ